MAKRKLFSLRLKESEPTEPQPIPYKIVIQQPAKATRPKKRGPYKRGKYQKTSKQRVKEIKPKVTLIGGGRPDVMIKRRKSVVDLQVPATTEIIGAGAGLGIGLGLKGTGKVAKTGYKWLVKKPVGLATRSATGAVKGRYRTRTRFGLGKKKRESIIEEQMKDIELRAKEARRQTGLIRAFKGQEKAKKDIDRYGIIPKGEE